jgi:hypothetical protein
VWNTIVRGDHQLNSNNTYSVRWLRESSPQTNQIIGAVTPAAAREESDVDQTLSANFNSVLSSTKVNTLRTTWTRENVAFANHCFNTNGRDLSQCEPTLAFQTFTDQQDNTAQARIGRRRSCWTRRWPGSCRASTATTTSSSARSTSTPGRST